MLKRIAIRKDGTISMSEFRKFAEKYQGEIDKLEEENRKLKEEIKNSKLYWDLMKEKEEYVEKRKMSNWKNNLNIGNVKKLEEENKKLNERIKELEEQRIFSLGEYDYMILTSTTPQLKLIKKENSDLYSNITIN